MTVIGHTHMLAAFQKVYSEALAKQDPAATIFRFLDARVLINPTLAVVQQVLTPFSYPFPVFSF